MLARWKRVRSSADDYFPEEWIASVVNARNPGREHLTEDGLSFVELEGETRLLKDLIASDPEGMLGAGNVRKFGSNPGILVKLLDSAERLTIQVHPDRESAQRLFGSPFGKTEAWYVLGTGRIDGVNPYVLFGFRPGVTRDRWEELFYRQDIDGMIQCLHKFEIEPGQVILVEAGIPHAIGPGCFLLEIQEPTDYTIRVERTTPKGLRLEDQSCHQGLGFDKMFDCFRYENFEAHEVMERWFVRSRVPESGPDGSWTELLGADRCPYFRMDEIAVRSRPVSIPPQSGFSVGIVIEGEGELRWRDGSETVAQGDNFFFPACVEDLVLTGGDRGMRMVRCFPPVSQHG
jgi:mannose-6-phosphate isomerase